MFDKYTDNKRVWLFTLNKYTDKIERGHLYLMHTQTKVILISTPHFIEGLNWLLYDCLFNRRYVILSFLFLFPFNSFMLGYSTCR